MRGMFDKFIPDVAVFSDNTASADIRIISALDLYVSINRHQGIRRSSIQYAGLFCTRPV